MSSIPRDHDRPRGTLAAYLDVTRARVTRGASRGGGRRTAETLDIRLRVAEIPARLDVHAAVKHISLSRDAVGALDGRPVPGVPLQGARFRGEDS
jgi:hypothetical protein